MKSLCLFKRPRLNNISCKRLRLRTHQYRERRRSQAFAFKRGRLNGRKTI